MSDTNDSDTKSSDAQAQAETRSAETRSAETRSAETRSAETRSQGYHMGAVDTVISVDDVQKQAEAMAHTAVTTAELQKLTEDVGGGAEPFVNIDGLNAGYGQMQILHEFGLRLGKGQSLCLIGPNGAGKSTVLHSIFGFTNIFGGKVHVGDRDVTALAPNEKLSSAGIAYILQDKSVFPGMTVEENLLMGGYLMPTPADAQRAATKILDKYDRLAARRSHKAGVLSGGERRLLEISRALVMEPDVLLVDEPSIGLEPRYIDMVFEILEDLQRKDGKTLIMVEQNAKRGLEFADIGYVLVSGRIAVAGKGNDLLDNPDVGRLFLGG